VLYLFIQNKYTVINKSYNRLLSASEKNPLKVKKANNNKIIQYNKYANNILLKFHENKSST
jgi:hypothetical protein